MEFCDRRLLRRIHQLTIGRLRAGRWTLLSPIEWRESPQALEHLARLFLSCYGIVLRELLGKEALSPPWRELSPVYRRLEARGEVRGCLR
ncbi:MAG: hypothetical protein HYZ28_05655 [Myxococcales bacterium]|nr:hypothetical protein [Myxococcales bacterium]